jgi:ABC-2 type transport system ATP-binding protein
MIEALSLVKNYGKERGVKDINFTVKDGEILGFLGRNGAGKTTTMNILTGYYTPDDGTVLINGTDICENSAKAKRQIGYLPENPPLYPDHTVGSYLDFVCDLKSVKSSYKKQHIKDIMELTGILDVGLRVIKNLSKGYKQRIGLAQALISDPQVIILDEPTVGLDPKQISDIRLLIRNLGKKHSVILSSHILSEVSQICDRVIIIDNGEIIATDTPENLSNKFAVFSRLSVKISGLQEGIIQLIKSIPGVLKVETEFEKNNDTETMNDYIIESDKNTDIVRPLFFKLAENGYVIYVMKPADLNLEDVFIKLTNKNEGTEC